MENVKGPQSSKSEDKDGSAGQEEFEASYKELRNFAFSYIYSLIKNAEDAEELTHDSLLKLYSYAEKVRNPRHLLGKIATNKVLDYYRKNRARKNLPGLIRLEDHRVIAESLTASGTDPNKKLDQDEQYQRLLIMYVLILNCERDERYVPIIIKGLGDEEAASLLSEDLETVRHDLNLARVNLRRKPRALIIELDVNKVPRVPDAVFNYVVEHYAR